MVAENNISYESTSFREFEKLLQDCVANHFLDHNADDDQDSMASESSFSGYVNEGCYSGRRQNSALSMKRGIMSDKAYHRMKGIIARKKNVTSNDPMQFVPSQEKGTTTITKNNDNITSHSFENQFESDTTISENSFVELFPSKIYDMTTSPVSKASEGNNASMNISIKHESDSSDSILDNILPRQTRQRRYRRRTKNKRMLRGESITPDGISENADQEIDQKISILLSDPWSKEKALHFTTEQAPGSKDFDVARLRLTLDKYTNGLQSCTHLKRQSCQDKSDTTGRSSNDISSELHIDTTNSILPSLVKKGIKYYDMPKIEHALTTKLSKSHTMNRKQKVLYQLLERCALRINNEGIALKGMALVHKMRAERKMALQATYLRYSIRQRRDDSEEGPRLATPTDTRDESPKILKLDYHQQEAIAPSSPLHDFLECSSSLSSFSSIEEKNRFQVFIDKTKRTLSNSRNHHDKEGLLHNQSNDQFRMCCSYSSPDEAVLMPKTSPFEKMMFSCSKERVHYETLSPASSLTNNTSWNDSDNFSITVRSTDSNNQDESQLQSSDCSEWSEMSFLSDQNRVAESVVRSPESSDTNIASYRSQTNSHQTVRLPLTPLGELKTFDDSFDEIVLRNKSNPFDKNLSNRLGDESPTGVIDFVSLLQFQHEEKAGDALAFVDDDEGDHVFTDKDDSFVMKSPEQKLRFTPPICRPVFLSPSRFEI
jgi:hypothetical protein